MPVKPAIEDIGSREAKMRSKTSRIPTVLLMFVLGTASAQTSKKATAPEQRVFGLELPIAKPAPIPNTVLRVLREDSAVKNNVCEQENPSDETLRSWLVASEVHLADSGEPTLLVQAKVCLSGANEGPFWIFKHLSEGGYELILSVNALGIKVCNARTNGYHDISAGAAVGGGKATYVLYKFDGRSYKPTGTNDETEECK
jgi:hypothetical protein